MKRPSSFEETPFVRVSVLAKDGPAFQVTISSDQGACKWNPPDSRLTSWQGHENIFQHLCEN